MYAAIIMVNGVVSYFRFFYVVFSHFFVTYYVDGYFEYEINVC